MLPNVSDLCGQSVAELVLEGEVPLLTHCRLEILVCDPDPGVRIAGKVDRRAIRGRCKASPFIVDRCDGQTQDPCCVSLRKNSQRWVHGELFVGTTALGERRNCVPASDYSLASQRCRRPGKPDSRLPIAFAQVVVIEPTIAELLG